MSGSVQDQSWGVPTTTRLELRHTSADYRSTHPTLCGHPSRMHLFVASQHCKSRSSTAPLLTPCRRTSRASIGAIISAQQHKIREALSAQVECEEEMRVALCTAVKATDGLLRASTAEGAGLWEVLLRAVQGEWVRPVFGGRNGSAAVPLGP